MQKRNLITAGFLLFCALTAFLCAGCPRGTEQDEDPAPTPGAEIDINSLTAQWDESGHALIMPFPNSRDGCILCHDGHAFARQIEAVADIPEGRRVGEEEEIVAVTSIDCAACHTGHGLDLWEQGTAGIPTAESVNAGSGAMCMTCHNSRRAPDINDARRSSPHYSSQADVMTGTGGMRLDDFEVGGTAAHQNIENSCTGCHLAEGPGGFAYHGFDMPSDLIGPACGGCHQGITAYNLAGGGDYDGDGTAEGFQDEVQGLLDLLRNAIGEALEGGDFTSQGGAFVFSNADGEAIEEVEDEVYLAAYNWYLISNDGSLGLHNPAFAVRLLQQSYRALTGEEVPAADTP